MMHHVSVLLPWQRTYEKQSMRKKSLSVIHGFQGCSPSWAGRMAFMPAAKQEHHSRRAGQAMRMGWDQGVTFKVTSPGTCTHLPGSHLPVVPSAMNWWSYTTLKVRVLQHYCVEEHVFNSKIFQRTLLQVCSLISKFPRPPLLLMSSFIGAQNSLVQISTVENALRLMLRLNKCVTLVNVCF